MLITDAQIHVWEVDRPDRPWPKEAERTPPQLPNGFSAEEALAQMDAAGVDRVVIVPPSWIGENNATALEAAARYPVRFAVMGRFDPRPPDARVQLERWLDQPHMLGIRMTFHTPPFAGMLDDGSLDWFWAACERLAIPLMVYVPGAAEKVQPVAERHPELRLVLDHMARPGGRRGPAAFADIDALLALARYPNVLVKVSSVPNYSAEPYPFRDLHPFLRRIYDSFGPRRLLWGSDLTRLTSSYRECLDLFRVALDFLSTEDNEWILGKTAATVLGWSEVAG